MTFVDYAIMRLSIYKWRFVSETVREHSHGIPLRLLVTAEATLVTRLSEQASYSPGILYNKLSNKHGHHTGPASRNIYMKHLQMWVVLLQNQLSKIAKLLNNIISKISMKIIDYRFVYMFLLFPINSQIAAPYKGSIRFDPT